LPLKDPAVEQELNDKLCNIPVAAKLLLCLGQEKIRPGTRVFKVMFLEAGNI